MSAQETAEFFRWRQHYVVGFQKIDREHQELAELLNRLHASVRPGKRRSEAGPALEKLIGAFKKHFRAEEKLMEEHGFPGLGGHRADHRSLIRKLEAFQTDFNNSRTSVNEEMLNGLKDWMRDHILLKDKPFGSFLEVRLLS